VQHTINKHNTIITHWDGHQMYNQGYTRPTLTSQLTYPQDSRMQNSRQCPLCSAGLR